ERREVRMELRKVQGRVAEAPKGAAAGERSVGVLDWWRTSRRHQRWRRQCWRRALWVTWSSGTLRISRGAAARGEKNVGMRRKPQRRTPGGVLD
ncbi:hypothetical protein KUCAC02_018971, partial [Chaenocephalus aceratus]